MPDGPKITKAQAHYLWLLDRIAKAAPEGLHVVTLVDIAEQKAIAEIYDCCPACAADIVLRAAQHYFDREPPEEPREVSLAQLGPTTRTAQ